MQDGERGRSQHAAQQGTHYVQPQLANAAAGQRVDDDGPDAHGRVERAARDGADGESAHCHCPTDGEAVERRVASCEILCITTSLKAGQQPLRQREEVGLVADTDNLATKSPRKATPKPLAQMLDLTGETAVVTGAAAGIGQATARRLAEAGARVILVDRDLLGLEALRDELEAAGARGVSVHEVDLLDSAAIDRFWDGLDGPVPTILVNNAGLYPAKAFHEVDDTLYRATVGVNLDAVFRMCQRFLKARYLRGGKIVNIGSIEAVLPFKEDLATYSVSKAAVIALTRALAREYAKHDVRANVVLPGGVITPGTREVAKGVLKGKVGLLKTGYDFIQRVPARRMGTPDEVARVVLFLCSGLATYMHGAVLAVDGGFLSS